MTAQQKDSKAAEKGSVSVHDALTLAATEGDLALVKTLLGEWIEKNPNWGRRYSSSRGKNRHADLNYYFHRAFDAAAEKDDFEILTYFMQQGFSVHDKAARSATSNRSYRALDLFLRYGWDINMRRWKFYPPILCYAVYQDDAAFVQWLLDYGANADVPPNDESDRNPLMTAASSASFEILKMLIACGAKADRGDVILFLAWPDCQDRTEKFQYLIDRGAPINQLEHSQCPSQFRMHSRLGLGTPLHKAVRTGEFDFAATLLAHGADPNIRDTKGKTPLDLARELERPEMVKILVGAEA